MDSFWCKVVFQSATASLWRREYVKRDNHNFCQQSCVRYKISHSCQSITVGNVNSRAAGMTAKSSLTRIEVKHRAAGTAGRETRRPPRLATVSLQLHQAALIQLFLFHVPVKHKQHDVLVFLCETVCIDQHRHHCISPISISTWLISRPGVTLFTVAEKPMSVIHGYLPPAIGQLSLPLLWATPEKWKAELTYVTGYILSDGK